jgi:hypothetical protein
MSSSTSSAVRIVVVSSWRPSRAMNTRVGWLIQISSTVGYAVVRRRRRREASTPVPHPVDQ